jgi:type IV pilus assembly protein PilB
MFKISTDSAKSISSLLLTKGVITDDQIKSVNKISAETGMNVIQLILENNYASEDTIAESIAKASSLPIVNLSESMVDKEALKLLPNDFCRSNRLLPYKIENEVLHIAISDHTRLSLAGNLKLIAKRPIEFSLSNLSNLFETMVAAGIDKAAKVEAPKAAVQKTAPSKKITKSSVEQKRQQRSSWKTSNVDASITATDADEKTYELEEEITEEQSSEVVYFVNDVLIKAVRTGTSDIHMEKFRESARVRFRVDGVMHEEEEYSIFLEQNYAAVTTRLKIMSELDISERRLPQDGAINFRERFEDIDIDIRLSILPNVRGERVVMRLLSKSAINIDLKQLGFYPKDLESLLASVSSPQGLVLVTGPTGSGKTTTLYSCLNLINEPNINILTAEDPVEYELEGIGQTQMREKIGLNFASALRSFLRQDPDVVLVGEIRDKETGDIAIKASLTGHLVLSTIHTNDAVSTISRLINMGIPTYLISAALSLVVAQRLARKICEECKEVDPNTTEQLLQQIGFTAEEASRMKSYKGSGCSNCNNTGYKGRQGIYEVLTVTAAMQDAILQNMSMTELYKLAADEGFATMQDMGRQLIGDGRISYEEFQRVLSS